MAKNTMGKAKTSTGVKNISRPDSHGFQVRINRDGAQYSRYFAIREYGGEQKALQAAINWREMKKAVLPPPRPFYKTIASNRSTGMVGVSKTVHHDRRRDVSYLRYRVSYQKGLGQSATRTFQAGPIGQLSADDELHAFRTAVAFRQEYEQCRLKGERFEPKKYKGWKRERLYVA